MIRKTLTTAVCAAGLLVCGFGQEIEYNVIESEFELDGNPYASTVVAPQASEGLPMVFMIPNWMGVTDQAVEKAKRVSDGRFVVYLADLYGRDVRPANSDEAKQAAGSLRADRTEMRTRGNAALAHFRGLAPDLGTDPSKVAAIGFCFGGGAVLEMARSGTEALAFVSFHGDLISPTLESDSVNIRGKVLVLHGAADPLVPPAHVHAFEAALSETEVDWTLISYGGAVHSFTDPTAAMEGTAMYCATTAHRSFHHMWATFNEIFPN